MKIEIVVDPRKAPNSLVARMGNPVQNGVNGRSDGSPRSLLSLVSHVASVVLSELGLEDSVEDAVVVVEEVEEEEVVDKMTVQSSLWKIWMPRWR